MPKAENKIIIKLTYIMLIIMIFQLAATLLPLWISKEHSNPGILKSAYRAIAEIFNYHQTDPSPDIDVLFEKEMRYVEFGRYLVIILGAILLISIIAESIRKRRITSFLAILYVIILLLLGFSSIYFPSLLSKSL